MNSHLRRIRKDYQKEAESRQRIERMIRNHSGMATFMRVTAMAAHLGDESIRGGPGVYGTQVLANPRGRSGPYFTAREINNNREEAKESIEDKEDKKRGYEDGRGYLEHKGWRFDNLLEKIWLGERWERMRSSRRKKRRHGRKWTTIMKELKQEDRRRGYQRRAHQLWDSEAFIRQAEEANYTDLPRLKNILEEELFLW